MLDQLFRSGKLSQVKAFVLGSFLDCPANGFPLSIAEMIREKAGNETPVFTGLPCGHASPSFPILLGYQTEISVSGGSLSLSQEALPLIS
jgi:muramoyltetrapeptide carboxypeptidase LdcA involved in peptidoglycan recycling